MCIRDRSRREAAEVRKSKAEEAARLEVQQEARKVAEESRKTAEALAQSRKEAAELRKSRAEDSYNKLMKEEARKAVEEARKTAEAVSRSKKEAEQARQAKQRAEMKQRAEEQARQRKAREAQLKADSDARWAKARQDAASGNSRPFSTKENWVPSFSPAESVFRQMFGPGGTPTEGERARAYAKREKEMRARWKTQAENRKREFEDKRDRKKRQPPSSSYKTPPRSRHQRKSTPSFMPKSKINIASNYPHQAQVYEKRWEAFENKPGAINIHDVPFPDPQALRKAAAHKGEYKKLMLRWHPDKWLQRFHHRIGKGQEEKMMERVTQTFQMLLSAKEKKLNYMQAG
eukprot:TRINITY_DN278_c0_g1_i6.p1 TRINITY_DN278_c0_g1~~TRINITY_DN278_c0_g1_i6.p1  ORF type:complete len:346 (+),score=95.78 TRINITY_DN278_c0_g1_i6:87-1124(+)